MGDAMKGSFIMFNVRVNYRDHHFYITQEAETVEEAVDIVSRIKPNALSWEARYIKYPEPGRCHCGHAHHEGSCPSCQCPRYTRHERT
ncbi:MAG: hypothetical protein GY906_28340 [bacterium]|nr:hypothetical protein [bacterium]